jgi:hypothetical protein
VKLLSIRDKKMIGAKEKNWGRDNQPDFVRHSQTLSGPTGLYPGRSLRQKNSRFLNFLGIKPNFADMYQDTKGINMQNISPSNQVWREISIKQFLEDFDNGTQNLAMGTSPYIGGC